MTLQTHSAPQFDDSPSRQDAGPDADAVPTVGMGPGRRVKGRAADAPPETAADLGPPGLSAHNGPQRTLVVRVHGDESCTLREAVDRAIAGYFADLGDAPASNLYALVLREVERPLLELTLARCDGNQSRAADALGIHRGTLRKKLREHGLV